MSVRSIVWIIGIGALIGAYIIFSSPGEIVVNDLGEVEGVVNKIRAKVQGGRFWINQLDLLNTELERELKKLQFQSEIIPEKVIAETYRKMFYEEAYRLNRPDLAEKLRKETDEIDAKFDQEMEQIQIEYIHFLRHLISIVNPKAR